jgi:PEP-CTERM motif
MTSPAFSRLAGRCGLRGAIGLAGLIFLAPISSAQVMIPLPALSATGGVTVGLPEIPGGPPEIGSWAIVGATFTDPAVPGEVDLLDPGSSDRILFDNSTIIAGKPTATITFLSDNEAGVLPPGPSYPFIVPPVPAAEFASIILGAVDNTLGGGLILSFIMTSDPASDPVPPPLQSDLLTMASIPEPSTLCLAGLSLASLAAIALRRTLVAQAR